MIEHGDGAVDRGGRRGCREQRRPPLGHRSSPAASPRTAAIFPIRAFFVSKAGLTGTRLADLPLPQMYRCRCCMCGATTSISCRRLISCWRSAIGLVSWCRPSGLTIARAFFGDTVKSTAEFSYVSVGFGMVLGVLLGLVPIPIPGVGTVTLGIGGGPLIVALIVGRLRRTGPISWVMPLPANIVLRNFGLTLFLATVGINSGQAFVTTVSQTGPLMLLIGAAVVLTTVLIVMLVGHYVMRIPLTICSASPRARPAILPSWSTRREWRRLSGRTSATP